MKTLRLELVLVYNFEEKESLMLKLDQYMRSEGGGMLSVGLGT